MSILLIWPVLRADQRHNAKGPESSLILGAKNTSHLESYCELSECFPAADLLAVEAGMAV